MKIIIYLSLLCAVMASCGARVHQDEAENHDSEHEHTGEIVMEPSAQRAEGVRVESLATASFSQVLHTSGRIVGAATGTMQLCAATSGVLSGVKVVPGSRVAAGQTLFTITALSQQAESAQVELEEAEAAMQRLERLAPDRLVGADELEAARTRLRQAQVAVRAASVSVTASAAGTVQQLLCSQGQYVEAGQPLAMVSCSGSTNLVAYVPQQQAVRMMAGTAMPYTAARFAVGDSVYTATAPIGCTTQVDENGCLGITFAGLPAALPIGSFCEVWLLGASRDGVLTLPLDAITEDQGTYYIYTREDEECFVRRAVVLGDSDGRRIEVLSGVKAGDNVVTQGAYAVRAAGQSASIPGHTHNH